VDVRHGPLRGAGDEPERLGQHHAHPRGRCPGNEQYAANVREAFTTDSSPGDFPEEHYERDLIDRFEFVELNPHRQQRLRPSGK
jgi:hypothetical protein